MIGFEIVDPQHLADDFLKEWFKDNSFVMAHTSGSTGTPKSICLSKNDMILSAKATCDYFSINSSSTLFCPLSPDYIAGKMMIVRAIVSGARLIMSPPSNQIKIESIEEIDLIPIVPSQVKSLSSVFHLSRINNVIVGGAPLNLEQRQLLSQAPFRTYLTYGMTETCSHVALAPLTLDPPVYKALHGITFTTTSESCLVINSQRSSFSPLVTNDIVELIDSMSFLWKGRKDNVINSGGFKISPEEIEAEIMPVLLKFPVSDYYISKRPSPVWGEEMILILESQEQLDEELILSELRNILPDKRKIPKNIIILPSFKRTANGKILRR